METRRRPSRFLHQVPRTAESMTRVRGEGTPGSRGHARALPEKGRGRGPTGNILNGRPRPDPPPHPAREFSGIVGGGRSAEGRHSVAARASPDVEFALRCRAEDAGAVPEDGGYPDHP